MAGQVTIRRAVPADAPAVARLHIRAWQWAYRGLVPDAVLDQLPAGSDRWEAHRRATIARAGREERTWVAELSGRVVGFADTGPSRDADTAPGTAEVYALYLDPDVVGTGVGQSLFSHAVADLQQRGYRAATLWVLETNARARRFYEVAGWYLDGAAKVEQRPGFDLREVRYRVDLAPAHR